MSFHARCPQRIASTCAHRCVWRRRDVRCYASGTTNGPEWFQHVRTELLSRKPLYQREDLDLLHHEQLLTTLGGFVPRLPQLDTASRPNVPLAQLLTRFNVRVVSSKLLPDGTDPLHSPGEPWVRRMWAGGSVKLHTALKPRSETPFRLQSRVACVERIKDVRVQGEGDAAKLFVTIERRFASVNQLRDAAENQPGGDVRALMLQQVDNGIEWGDALLKEERNLVFLKAKTAAELVAVQAGQTLVPRYLKSPTEPDFSYALTPTRSLLFRYSALTFNAHLLHLDPAYAQNAEGHRNLLVHGPLTLTLMLQTLAKHLRSSQIGTRLETVDSVEYRNLAPLYCDEEMRVCVKNKKRTDTGNVWDVWIEGPTGGMAVKAVVCTVDRGKNTQPTERAVEITAGTDVPDVQTVALQARDKLSALDQKDSGKEQWSQLSREERRKLWREERRQFSRSEQKEWAARPLSYLYSASSPLVVQASPPAPQAKQPSASPSSRTKLLSQVSQQGRPTPSRELIQYSNRWRKQWVGKALPYLYLWETSPLICRASPPSPQPNSAPAPTPMYSAAEVVKDADPEVKIRTIQSESPKDAPVPSLASIQKVAGSHNKSQTVRPRQRRARRLVIRKVEQVSVRKIDVGLGEAARRRGKSRGDTNVQKQRLALKKTVLAATGNGNGNGDKGAW